MKKVILVLSALFMTSIVFNTFAKAATLTPDTLMKSQAQSNVYEKKQMAIDYSGRDFRRSTVSLEKFNLNKGYYLV